MICLGLFRRIRPGERRTKIASQKPIIAGLAVKTFVAWQAFGRMFAEMDWQQMVSLVIVAAAGLALAAGRFGRRKFSFARDTHCGCAASPISASQSSIVFRARKGERPEVRVRMR